MPGGRDFAVDSVDNNVPWPERPTAAQNQKIETARRAVLDARAAHPNASLADLYDPLTMPPNLVKAHQALDAAVDAAYGRKGFKNDAERVAFLFELYQKYTSLLPAAAPARKSRKRTGPATVYWTGRRGPGVAYLDGVDRRHSWPDGLPAIFTPGTLRRAIMPPCSTSTCSARSPAIGCGTSSLAAWR